MQGFSFKHYTIMLFSDNQPNYSVTLVSAETFRETLQWHQQALSGMGGGPGFIFRTLSLTLRCPKGCVPLHTVRGEYQALGLSESWSLDPEHCWDPLACAGHRVTWWDPAVSRVLRCNGPPLAQPVNNPTPSWSPLTGEPFLALQKQGGRGGIGEMNKPRQEHAFDKGVLPQPCGCTLYSLSCLERKWV